jgi:nucleoside-diphosphate-sugar epimerase
MKVAVTGATGFIGQYVVQELEARSVDTISLIRPSSKRVTEIFSSRSVQFDLHKPPSNAYELLGFPDVLIHLAWSGLPNYKSLHHFEQELPAHYRFLKNMIESGLKSLLVAGTCAEYGMQSGLLSEKSALQPVNPYGFAKNALRCQLEYLKASHQFHLTWARLFYLYGDRQHLNSLLPQIRKAAEGGDCLFNMSGGEQLRDYLPVGVVAKHLVSLAMAGEDIGVINVCSGIPISVRRLAEGWIKENNWSIKLNLGQYPYPDYETMAFWGDPQKLNSLLS